MASGSKLWWMTFYLAEIESWFSSIRTQEMSFGLPYLKKHMLNSMVLMNIFQYAKASIQVSFISDLLQGGRCSDAMVDFTGGCPESFELSLEKRMENLFYSMKKSFDRKSLICCSIISKDPNNFEAKTPMGLVMGHAYTVTKVHFDLSLL